MAPTTGVTLRRNPIIILAIILVAALAAVLTGVFAITILSIDGGAATAETMAESRIGAGLGVGDGAAAADVAGGSVTDATDARDAQAGAVISLGDEPVPTSSGQEAKGLPLSAPPSTPHWSLFNLISTVLGLFVTLVLLIHLFFTLVGDHILQTVDDDELTNVEMLEKMEEAQGGPRGLGNLDDREAGKLLPFSDYAARAETARAKRQVTPFNMVCAGICSLLAIVAAVLFFAGENPDTLMVVFDDLSPLFVLILVLTLLMIVPSVMHGEKSTATIIPFPKRGI